MLSVTCSGRDDVEVVGVTDSYAVFGPASKTASRCSSESSQSNAVAGKAGSTFGSMCLCQSPTSTCWSWHTWTGSYCATRFESSPACVAFPRQVICGDKGHSQSSLWRSSAGSPPSRGRLMARLPLGGWSALNGARRKAQISASNEGKTATASSLGASKCLQQSQPAINGPTAAKL